MNTATARFDTVPERFPSKRGRFLFFKKQRVRMILTAVFLMFVIQVVLAAIGLTHASRVEADIRQQADSQMVTELNAGALSALKKISDLCSLLESPDFSGDFVKPLRLQDEALAMEKINEINSRINALNLSTDIFEKIFLIGEDAYRIQFAKTAGTSGWSDEELPDAETLEKTGMTAAIYAHYGALSYFLPGSLTNANVTGEPENTGRVMKFAKQLEGKIVFNNGKDNGVLIVVVVNPSFLRTILPQESDRGQSVSLLDDNGNRIWSSAAGAALGERIAKASAAYRNKEEARYPLAFQGQRYRNEFRALSPFKFGLIFTTNTDYSAEAFSEIVRKYMWGSIASLLITFGIAYVYTDRLLRPFKLLSRRLNKIALSDRFPLEPIADDNQGVLSSLSIRRKLLLLFAVSVIVPAISDGLLYASSLYSFSRSSFESAVPDISRYYRADVSAKADTYETLINRLSVSPQLQDLIFERKRSELGPFTPPLAAQISVFSFLQGFGDISYYVLLDPLGVPRYASIFSNNLKNFQTENNTPIRKDMELYWLTDIKDVFKLSNVALIKKIGNELYLELVLKNSAFQQDNSGPVRIAIVDRNKNIVYQNVAGKGDLQAALALGATPQGGSVRWLKQESPSRTAVYVETEPRTNWDVYVFHSYEGTISKNQALFYQYLLVIMLVFFVSILIGLYLSKLLVKPIEELKFQMEEAGRGEFHAHYLTHDRNEIGAFVRNFNRMISRIDRLVQENARILEENAGNRMKAQELAASKMEAELNMLQAQINPHFLYNTLEAINMRSLQYGTPDISRMVIALADIFRYSISSGPELVPLATEITHVKNYIAIQEVRFGSSFEVDWRIDPGALQEPVLKFILQPVVENAIHHGLSDYDEGGKLLLKAERNADLLLLTVEDNGMGMSSAKLEQLLHSLDSGYRKEPGTRGGVGLRNVRHRLKLYYGGRASVTVQSKPYEGTTVEIAVPVTRLPNHEGEEAEA